MTGLKKTDPRALRSKRMFKEALVALLSENVAITSLTVQKIANKAELNRATFYLHYVDINDLLRELVYDIFANLEEILTPLLRLESLNDREQLLAVLDYFYLHRKLFAVLVEEAGFKRKMHEVLKTFVQTRRSMRSFEGDPPRVSLDILAASLLGVIMWWIIEGNDYSSEFIANQVELLYRK
ncbi:TetR/AcrR family transcriptional regulator [Paenibacillus solani]|uniref:TetR/AcrR family transcriptional regulator n=1 Tax=Paenibacillus solani TaxID=1705565 RepID=UPI003D28AAD7